MKGAVQSVYLSTSHNPESSGEESLNEDLSTSGWPSACLWRIVLLFIRVFVTTTGTRTEVVGCQRSFLDLAALALAASSGLREVSTKLQAEPSNSPFVLVFEIRNPQLRLLSVPKTPSSSPGLSTPGSCPSTWSPEDPSPPQQLKRLTAY